MSLKRWVAERALEAGALVWGRPAPIPADPESIFVLRNNDIGDLIVITPLFEALRRRFPAARIVAGVGAWSAPVLDHNPHLSGRLIVNAPWHNKAMPSVTPAAGLRYILWSEEVRALERARFSVGIDVLGSPQGSLLMMRAGIRCRLGVRGYAGGHGVTSAWVEYDSRRHVARAALAFAELMGARELPPAVPQLFLTADERADGERRWRAPRRAAGAPPRRIVVAPGAGLDEKQWPAAKFEALVRRLAETDDVDVVVVGGARERAIGAALAGVSPSVRSAAGALALRQTFAVVATADAVVTSPSMAMHVAAAFRVPAVVVLGPLYTSAEQHEIQWGYPDMQRALGFTGDAANAATPDGALAALAAVTGSPVIPRRI